MVSRSFITTFQNIFRRSFYSREKNEQEDISSDISMTGDIERDKSDLYEREETTKCTSHESYFSNVQPRTSIIKSCENHEKNETDTQNNMTTKKPGTSDECIHSKKGSRGERKTSSVSPASSPEKDTSDENEENSDSSLIPDSQAIANISPVTSDYAPETDSNESESSSPESECSFDSSPKGIYDLCESQPKFYCPKRGDETENDDDWKKSGEESKGVDDRVRNGASAKQEASRKRKRKPIDEELGTVILNKRISSSMKKISSENKKSWKTKENGSVGKSDMLIRLRLPLSGSNRKKLFAVKLSKLISLVSNKRHPLNKWAGKLSVENLDLLNDNEFKVLIKILSHFVCVKIVRR